MIKRRVVLGSIPVITGSVFALSSCTEEQVSTVDFEAGPTGKDALRIVAGSEQQVLEPIIAEYAEKNKVHIQMTYKGSLDIMRELTAGAEEYDAVWAANSMWITLGDDKKIVKNAKTTAITPVVFGMKKSKADELGFTNKSDLLVQDFIDAIDSKKLSFAMTSATQSNSGASAYLGFLSAIAQNPNGLSLEDLNNKEVQEKATKLLSGVNRSSGSSNWLVELFLQGDYDAMVNYEQLIIQTNIELKKQKKETLVLLYPQDGVTLSDAPLGFIDHKLDDVEQRFNDFQKYILSNAAQVKIEKTGKRNAYGKVSDANKKVYSAWGIDVDKTLSIVKMPSKEVIFEALNLYQTKLKKPAMTIYVLDYSGSMQGKRFNAMKNALKSVMVPAEAKKNYLLGNDKDKTVAIPFSDKPHDPMEADGYSTSLSDVYNSLSNFPVDGGTYLFEALNSAMEYVKSYSREELSNYTVAIIALTDGEANGEMSLEQFEKIYQQDKIDVPIFSILFGESSSEDLESLAKISNAKVFDGTSNLTDAFRDVKGYN